MREREILGKVREVDPLVAEIAQASCEQSTGISQLNTAIGQMDRVTQQNASSAEETAAPAQQLSAQAALLLQATDEMQALTVGKSAPVRKPAPVAKVRTKPTTTPIQRVVRPRSAPSRPSRLSIPAAQVPASIAAGSPRLSFGKDAHFEA